MKFCYVDNPEKWVTKGIDELLAEYGQPFNRDYSPDESANSDILQDLLDMQDPEFMIEYTRQHQQGVLLVEESEYEYFERLITQVMRNEESYSEMNRLHLEVDDDPAADPLWEVCEERVRVIEETARYIKERPADTLELVNRVYDKYTTALQDYLAEREGL